MVFLICRIRNFNILFNFLVAIFVLLILTHHHLPFLDHLFGLLQNLRHFYDLNLIVLSNHLHLHPQILDKMVNNFSNPDLLQHLYRNRILIKHFEQLSPHCDPHFGDNFPWIIPQLEPLSLLSFFIHPHKRFHFFQNLLLHLKKPVVAYR